MCEACYISGKRIPFLHIHLSICLSEYLSIQLSTKQLISLLVFLPACPPVLLRIKRKENYRKEEKERQKERMTERKRGRNTHTHGRSDRRKKKKSTTTKKKRKKKRRRRRRKKEKRKTDRKKESSVRRRLVDP